MSIYDIVHRINDVFGEPDQDAKKFLKTLDRKHIFKLDTVWKGHRCDICPRVPENFVQEAQKMSAVLQKDACKACSIFSEFFSECPDTIFVRDVKSSSNIYTSTKLAQMTGFRNQLNSRNIMYPGDWERIKETCARIDKYDKSASLTISIKHNLGGWRTIEMMGMPFKRDDDGKLLTIIGYGKLNRKLAAKRV